MDYARQGPVRPHIAEEIIDLVLRVSRRDRRGGNDVVCGDEIGETGEMDIQHKNHGRRLRTLID